MVGWHHQLNGHEFEPAPGVADGRGSLACCSRWGCKEADMTDLLSKVWSQCLVFICARTLGPHRGNVWAVDHDLWLSYPTVNHQKCEVSVCSSSLFVLWDHTKAKWAVDHTFWFSDCTYQKCEVSVCSSSVLALWVHTKIMYELLITCFDFITKLVPNTNAQRWPTSQFPSSSSPSLCLLYQKCEVSVCSSSVLALWVHTKAMYELLITPVYYFSKPWPVRSVKSVSALHLCLHSGSTWRQCMSCWWCAFIISANRDLACRVQAAQTLEDGEGPSGQKGCQSQPPALHRPAGKRHEGGWGDQCGRGRAPAGKTRSLPVVTLKWNKTYKTLELLCIPDF